MTLLRVFLMLGAIIVSVQSFPRTTRDYEKESTLKVETEVTDPTLWQTQSPKAILDMPTDSKGESSIEFVLKDPKEGLTFQSSLIRDKYTISNLNKKKETEELNLKHSSEKKEIKIFRNDELDKVNITGVSKSEDLPYEEIQIKRDQWLFNPQEMSSLIGGMPKYFYDAAKPVHPFPELSETIREVEIDSEIEKFRAPMQEKSNQPPQTSGPLLYPQSVFSRQIDIPFFV